MEFCPFGIHFLVIGDLSLSKISRVSILLFGLVLIKYDFI
jgi:hypothetical protein